MSTGALISLDAFLGPAGGEMALAFAAGAAAGYAFCMRTLYKMLKEQAEKSEKDCHERIEKLEEEKGELERRVSILEDRLYTGMQRQSAQIRDSTVEILGRDKLGGPL